ncbi:MAG: GNAT family N-acetyltransferase [Thermoplasmata archaeon]
MNSASKTGASEDVTIRRCAASDLRACAELAAQAWPSRTSSMSWNDQVAGMEGYMMSTLAASTWAEVLEESGRVVGFLYGRIDKHWKAGMRLMPKRSRFSAVSAFIASRRERPLWFLRMMWHMAMTELKLYLNRPHSDAEITMLIVDAAHRGKGYGRLLVERFIDVAKAGGASAVTVYTDDQSSNWRFYERIGFTRAAEFFDNVASFWVGRPAKGIIYVLTLESTQIQTNPA